jgi:hypothetical protein
VSLPTIATSWTLQRSYQIQPAPAWVFNKGTLTGYSWKERDRNDSCPYSVIGWLFRMDRYGVTWEEPFELVDYRKIHRHCNVPLSYRKTKLTFGSEPKGSNMKQLKERSHITPARIQALKAWV